jgi:hypothetical protein
MGRDGYDGRPGPRGERGAEGKQGPLAPMIAAWGIDPAAFTITPTYSDGSRGPPICLLPMFESAFEQADAADAFEQADADNAARALVEREVAAHWAR